MAATDVGEDSTGKDDRPAERGDAPDKEDK